MLALTLADATAPFQKKTNREGWSNDLVVKALDSQSRGPVFKTTG